ncbi:MAG: FAD-dependent oxidoreductase [Acidimicrobiia bacterium]
MADAPVTDVDVIVVGAGPAGAAAALTLARAGRNVVLVERGPFPGSKNMYGGVIYGRVLDEIIPRWWDEAPIQRWVTRRSTMIMTPTQALTVDFRAENWGKPPYNGATAYRPDFDSWFAGKATDAGAQLVTSTVATGLLMDGDRVVGIRTDRPGGELTAKVVIACDGVNSFLAKEAGLYTHTEASNFTLGVKETIALPRDLIDQRFGVRGREGVDIEVIGCTSGIPGGGFIYTNLDTISVGLVLRLSELSKQQHRPEELLGRFKAHDAVTPLVEGGDVKEYSAHLIPEAGYEMMPKLSTNGMLVAGDAAAMCLAAGIWLEGVNFAIGSGIAAGAAAADAIAKGDTSEAGLAGYRQRLESNFVLKDHKKLRKAPHLIMNDRSQHHYPQIAANIIEDIFTVTNPAPKMGFSKIILRELRKGSVPLRGAITDAWHGLRSYG